MKAYALVLLLTGGVFAGGCKKALEENPKTFISPDQFFTTADQCTQAVNGAYSSLYNLYTNTTFWASSEEGTDLTITADANNLIPNNYTMSSGSVFVSFWGSMYSAIKNDNMIINRISKAPIDESLKARLIGETKFLRALWYFTLTNTWGDVPLWIDELDVDAVSSLPRSSVADVRAQMIKDLTDAAAALPLSYDPADVGRVTKGAALTLLAKVYLYNKDWANAQKAALQVVQSNQYALLTDYSNLFDMQERYNDNKESIFEVHFQRIAASGTNVKIHNLVSYYMMARDAGANTYAGVDFGSNVVITGWYVFIPTMRLVSMFEDNDLRKNVVLGYGYNGQTFNRWPKPDGRPWFGPKFWDLNANSTASGKDLYVLRYADVLLMLAEAYNEQGNTTESLKYINQIRERAGLADLSGVSQEGIRTELFKERAIEFVGEFQRRYDLVRWGKLEDAVKSVADENTVGAANFKSYMKLYPISADEIIKDPNLTQNPGY
ncbi:RagB/SusD family nutrient uptake outer membrane protein [Compostibacter hankyongensis]